MGSERASRAVAFRQIGGDGVVARLRLYIIVALRLSHMNRMNGFFIGTV